MNEFTKSFCTECDRTSESLSRREFMQAGVGGGLGLSLFGSLQHLLAEGAANPEAQAKSVILLWLNGGPSHLDTWDPKNDSSTKGSFKSIATSVPGIRICEHMPKLARQMKDFTILRSMSSAEGNHQRARYLMHTSYAPSGTVKHPGFGAIVSSEIGSEEIDLPSFVSIRGPSQGGGLLGAKHSPFFISDPTKPIANLSNPSGVSTDRFDRRVKLLNYLEKNFSRSRQREEVDSHHEVYGKAVKLVKSPSIKAFDLSKERESLRSSYGKNVFGQGCLMARRLVQSGVKFVEVTLDGWDTHQENFTRTENLLAQLDPAMSTLLQDLKSRGMLESTLVICMGEFGRTPRINSNNGRGHFPRAWSFTIAGGGVQGGRVIGLTSRDGSEVKKDKVTPPDLFTTLSYSLGIDPKKQNYSSRGRPIKLVSGGKVIETLFT